jgi:short-subunit dehydrogenase
LAIITGASSGIGFQLAQCCAEDGHDLLIAADEPDIEEAAILLRGHGVEVTAVHADLAQRAGVERLCAELNGRPLAALLANAGHGLGGAFLDRERDALQHVVDTNISGTLYLVHTVARIMRAQRHGRILITGSMAGFAPGAFQAVYNASQAFIASFAAALRQELKASGVTVSCLLPGATDTQFFQRADMQDSRVAMAPHKANPAQVARLGYQAMQEGQADVVSGTKAKLALAMMKLIPAQLVAEQT